jgi:hypothetical protein
VTKVAYALVPLDPDGNPVDGAQYVHIADAVVAVGTHVQLPAFGFDQWEVVRVVPSGIDTKPQSRIVNVRDEAGQDLPVMGTLIIRGVPPPQTAAAPDAAQSGLDEASRPDSRSLQVHNL